MAAWEGRSLAARALTPHAVDAILVPWRFESLVKDVTHTLNESSVGSCARFRPNGAIPSESGISISMGHGYAYGE